MCSLWWVNQRQSGKASHRKFLCRYPAQRNSTTVTWLQLQRGFKRVSKKLMESPLSGYPYTNCFWIISFKPENWDRFGVNSGWTRQIRHDIVCGRIHSNAEVLGSDVRYGGYCGNMGAYRPTWSHVLPHRCWRCTFFHWRFRGHSGGYRSLTIGWVNIYHIIWQRLVMVYNWSTFLPRSGTIGGLSFVWFRALSNRDQLESGLIPTRQIQRETWKVESEVYFVRWFWKFFEGRWPHFSLVHNRTDPSQNGFLVTPRCISMEGPTDVQSTSLKTSMGISAIDDKWSLQYVNQHNTKGAQLFWVEPDSQMYPGS